MLRPVLNSLAADSGVKAADSADFVATDSVEALAVVSAPSSASVSDSADKRK